MPQHGDVEIRNGIPWVYRDPPGRWVVKGVAEPLHHPAVRPARRVRPEPRHQPDDD